MKYIILLIVLQGCTTARQQFKQHIASGRIVPTGQHEGRQMYATDTIEYAYKGELLRYIRKGTFIYNEALKD